jgi:regulator of protease activity HflC (stomatin/prohibitin superfamily)
MILVGKSRYQYKVRQKMGLNSILLFLALLGALMVIGGIGIAVSNAAQNRPAQPGIVLALIGLVVGLVFFIAGTGVVTVDATEVAVVFQSIGGDPANGSLWASPLGPGVHIITPFINTPTIYSTVNQTYTMSKTPSEGQVQGDDAVTVLTSDGQTVQLDVSVIYRVDPTKVNTLHLKYQTRYQDDFVRPTTQAAIRDIVSGYSVEQLYGSGRNEVAPKVLAVLAPEYSDAGLELRDVLVRTITFSDTFVKAIEDKQIAGQQAQQAIQEAERARTLAKGQADAAVTAAEGQANANVAEAKGEAQAIELQAVADADALGLINVQLQKNPQLIEWRYIEKLAQDVKLVLIPSNSPYLFDLQGLQNGALGSSTTSSATSTPTTSNTTATPQPTPTATQ